MPGPGGAGGEPIILLPFEDLDRDGRRDSEDGGLNGWTAALTGERVAPRTATTDANGTYRFDDIEQGTYRLSVQPPRGWRPTTPEAGVYTVTVGVPPARTFDFGFAKTQP